MGRLGLWEFSAAVAGWNRANSDQVEPPSDDEFETMKRAAAVQEARMQEAGIA